VTLRRAALAVAGVAVLAAPLALGRHETWYVNLASQVLIAAIYALSLDLLVGYGGLTSLGHAVYLGVTAYAVAWLTTAGGMGHLPAAAIALGGGTLLAAVCGLVALRASGLGFVMITLAIGQVFWGVAYRWVSLTGGDNGLTGVTRPAPLGVELDSPARFYAFTAMVFLAFLAAFARLVASPFGACLRGVRDQPRRMEALGHHVWLVRWVAFVLAGFGGSVAGVLYAYYHGFVSPHALSLTSSAEVLLMVIAGGAGTIAGPVVGAALVLVLKNVVSAYVERWLFLLGGAFVVIVLLVPDGLVPGVRLAWASRRGRAGRPEQAVPAGAPQPATPPAAGPQAAQPRAAATRGTSA
jgi:branched-chain amino acid transport system permease protein